MIYNVKTVTIDIELTPLSYKEPEQAVSDTVPETTDETVSVPDTQTAAPDTGNNADIVLYITIPLAAVLTAVAVIYIRRRNA